MKKSPAYMIIFLSVLGIICAGLLAGVNVLTKDKLAANEAKKLEQSLAALSISSPSKVDGEVVNDSVVGMYQGTYTASGANTPCYVFELAESNKFTSFSVLIAIDMDGKLIAISPKGTSGFTTHGMDKSFVGNSFGVVGSTSTDYTSNFKGVSGATYSSGSVKAAIETAFLQFAKIGGNK